MREALARAAFERADAANKDGGGRYAGDGFLEVRTRLCLLLATGTDW